MAQPSGDSAAKKQHVDSEFHYEHWKPRFNPWVIAFTVTLATFMEALDSSHRQRRPAAYRRVTRRQLRRGHMDADVLSGVQRHRSAHQRLDRQPHRPQALLHELRRAFTIFSFCCGLANSLPC